MSREELAPRGGGEPIRDKFGELMITMPYVHPDASDNERVGLSLSASVEGECRLFCFPKLHASLGVGIIPDQPSCSSWHRNDSCSLQDTRNIVHARSARYILSVEKPALMARCTQHESDVQIAISD